MCLTSGKIIFLFRCIEMKAGDSCLKIPHINGLKPVFPGMVR